MHFKRIFITVGTTQFDNLLKTISTEEFAQVFQSLGCRNLTIQYGNGSAFESKWFTAAGIDMIAYRMKNQIIDDLKEADLVISHAGAGTCSEALREKKPLVVVINEELMGNHQSELAEQLGKENYLFYCTPNNLKRTLLNSNFDGLKIYQKGNVSNFVIQLNKLMSF